MNKRRNSSRASTLRATLTVLAILAPVAWVSLAHSNTPAQNSRQDGGVMDQGPSPEPARSSAHALLREISLQQRVANAELIIEGKVVSKNSFWNADQTMIYTSNRVEITKVFKGTAPSGVIDLLTVGGVVEHRKITTDSLLSLEVNETGVFFCETVRRFRALPPATRGTFRYEAYASKQGFIKYDVNEQTASDPFQTYHDLKNDLYDVLSPGYYEVRPLKIPSTAQPASIGLINAPTAITDFSPTTITAGTGSVLTINGSGFGATQGSGTVRFRNADDGGATVVTPLASQYVSWSSTQIQVRVPQNAGTGTIQVVQGPTFTSATPLTVTFAHLNVDFDPGSGTEAYGPDHVNDNGSGGYTWRMNAGFDANGVSRDSFLRAFDSWKCATGINWTIGSTTSINEAVSDGTNIICFDNTAPLSAGVIAVCYSYWSGCASGPTIIWYVNELDMIFDDGSNLSPLTWQFGPAAPSASEFDFESYALHELGHGHQLGHVIDSNSVMHFTIGAGVSRRALAANDLAGGNFVQAKSEVANICGPGLMTHFSCATPAISISKLTNGTNNDAAPGVFVPVSSTVTFTYVVTNTGNVPLSGVTVLDDNGTPGNAADDFNATFVGGDSDSDGQLDTTEAWTFTASRI